MRHTRFAIVDDSATVTTYMCHPSVARFVPGEGFELFRRRNVGRLGTQGWLGLYWARTLTCPS